MLSPQHEERIARQVAQCLERCAHTDRPFRQASTFIDSLQGDPELAHEEIVEVQRRVLRALLDQRRPQQSNTAETLDPR